MPRFTFFYPVLFQRLWIKIYLLFLNFREWSHTLPLNHQILDDVLIVKPFVEIQAIKLQYLSDSDRYLKNCITQ